MLLRWWYYYCSTADYVVIVTYANREELDFFSISCMGAMSICVNNCEWSKSEETREMYKWVRMQPAPPSPTTVGVVIVGYT